MPGTDFTPQAWTYNKRAAIVLGVTQHSAAVADHVKLHRLKQLLVKLVEKKGDAAVSVEQVRGDMHTASGEDSTTAAASSNMPKSSAAWPRQSTGCTISVMGAIMTHGLLLCDC